MKKYTVLLTLLFAAPAFGADAASSESAAKASMEKGDFDGAAGSYLEAVEAYLAKGFREKAAETALGAFSALAGSKKPELAGPFAACVLDAAKGDAFPRLKARLEESLSTGLEALRSKKAFKEGVSLLECAIGEMEKRKVSSAGLSEGHLRRCMDVFLIGAKEYEKAAANGQALAAIGKETRYAYWEAAGSLCAGRAHCLGGRHGEALQALDAALKSARSIHDMVREGRIHIWIGETRCALEQYEEAKQSAARAEKTFRVMRDRSGEADARNLMLKIARAMGDEEEVRRLTGSISASGGAGGAGGAGGDANIAAQAVEFCKKAGEQERDVPVMQIYKKGNLLVFRNLFSRKESAVRIEQRFHYESVFGVHFRVRGREIQFWRYAPMEGLPGLPGESVSLVDGEVRIQGPDMDPFRVRHFAEKGMVVLTSSGQLSWRSR